MSSPNLTLLEQILLDDLQANTTTNPVFTAVSSAGDGRRALNDAYRIIWEKSGARLATAAHSTLWSTVVGSGTRRLTGILGSIAEVVQLWNTSTSSSTGGDSGDVLMHPTDLEEIQFHRNYSSSTTGAGTYGAPILYALNRSTPGAFGAVASVTLLAAGSGYTTGTGKATSGGTGTGCTINILTTGGGGSIATISATPTAAGTGYTVGDILTVTTGGTLGTVTVTTITATSSTNLLRAEFWPDATGALYFPAHYIPQFTEMTAGSDVPDVNDTEAYDIAHLAALWNAVAIGRDDLAETIAMKISEGTQAMFDRKVAAMIDARQNRSIVQGP